MSFDKKSVDWYTVKARIEESLSFIIMILTCGVLFSIIVWMWQFIIINDLI